eukprot:365025-Chlamydomonas_euryale.AAC.2
MHACTPGRATLRDSMLTDEQDRVLSNPALVQPGRSGRSGATCASCVEGFSSPKTARWRRYCGAAATKQQRAATAATQQCAAAAATQQRGAAGAMQQCGAAAAVQHCGAAVAMQRCGAAACVPRLDAGFAQRCRCPRPSWFGKDKATRKATRKEKKPPEKHHVRPPYTRACSSGLGNPKCGPDAQGHAAVVSGMQSVGRPCTRARVEVRQSKTKSNESKRSYSSSKAWYAATARCVDAAGCTGVATPF